MLPGVEAPEAPEPEGKTIMGADGYNYWKTGPEKGQRVLPGVEAAQAGPQTVVNVTNQPDSLRSPPSHSLRRS